MNPKPPPDTLPTFAITLVGSPTVKGFVSGKDEADAIHHYCQLYPLALGYKDMLRATLTHPPRKARG